MKRLLFALFALSIAVPAHAQEKLVVSIWGGSWRDLVADTVAKKFTQETGVPVDYITGGTIDRLNKAKLAKDNPESDITFTTSHVGWLYISSGLFEKLEMSKIPNAKNLVDEARFSPYHLGSWAYVYTIGYRTDLIKDIKFNFLERSLESGAEGQNRCSGFRSKPSHSRGRDPVGRRCRALAKRRSKVKGTKAEF